MAIKRYDPNQIKTRQDLMEFRASVEALYSKSCHHILSIVIFTAINIFLLVTNSSMYFLFSAAMPRMLVDLGMLLCGKYPAEYYGGDTTGYTFFSNTFFIIMLAGAVLILGFYLLCWYLAAKKRKVAWMIVTLVLFSLDSILLFYWYGFSSDMMVDLAFRIWIIISLILGICAHFDLKKAPADLPPAATAYTEFNLTPSAEEPVQEDVTETKPEEHTEE